MEAWEIVFICLLAILALMFLFCFVVLLYYAMNALVYILACFCVWICPPISAGSEATSEEEVKVADEMEKSKSMPAMAIEFPPVYTPTPTPVITPVISRPGSPISPIRI